jgi:hypothetical protein
VGRVGHAGPSGYLGVRRGVGEGEGRRVETEPIASAASSPGPKKSIM